MATRTCQRTVVTTLVSLVALTIGLPDAVAQAPDRVFPEPSDSTDFITHGPDYEPEQFKDGMLELQQRHPRYLHFSTIREEMDDPRAVSVGEDEVPAWHPDDTGDGQDFYVVSVTDRTVPDEDKGYVLFTVAHAAEYCGREAIPRFFEDLVTLVETAPDTVLDGGTGLDVTPLEITVAQALRETKLLFVDVAPDGWVAGDQNVQHVGPFTLRGYSQSNGAGVNGNRVGYQDGWVFPDDEVIRDNGFSTMTQPEGIVPTQYLRQMREREINGRPFATSMDFHGPAPVGAMIFSDQGNEPAKLDRLHDLAERITQRAYGVLGEYATEQGAFAHKEFAGSAEDIRRAAFSVYQEVFGGVDEKALYLTLHWNEYATAWEHIDYTVSSTWGGWAASNSGLDADAFSHEQPCQVLSEHWDPQSMQLYVDNIRAMAQAMVVHAAFRDEREVIARHDLGGAIGFVDSGERVTDADGNPSPPPAGVRNPLVGELEQVPYDVANTDYFRDLRETTSTSILELGPDDLATGLPDLATIVVADHTDADPSRLRAFAEAGGNVVLTDSALRLVPDVFDLPEDSIAQHHAYVGYADLDDEHPMTEGLYDRARQMFDPVGLGYPLLMERDQYWPCGGGCEESITQNSAPLWTVDRAAWEAAGGETVGTADPPEDRKGAFEGQDTNRTILGTATVGEGRVIIFGGVLPQPSEDHPHWFGLDAYTVSIPGHQLLLRALTWPTTIGGTSTGGTGTGTGTASTGGSDGTSTSGASTGSASGTATTSSDGTATTGTTTPSTGGGAGVAAFALLALGALIRRRGRQRDPIHLRR